MRVHRLDFAVVLVVDLGTLVQLGRGQVVLVLDGHVVDEAGAVRHLVEGRRVGHNNSGESSGSES